MEKWLVIDANGLAHRAFHTTGGLRYNNTATGVTYGFLGTIIELQGRFNTERVAFCFDRGRSIRRKVLKGYKGTRQKTRKEYTEEEQRTYAELQKQITDLRRIYLPEIGFNNIFSQKGYEADDLICSVCRNMSEEQEAIIVSADQDMFQLLSKRVQIWSPTKKELWTRKRFQNVYGITPKQWIQVKAIAGCATDEIPGIFGIGEKSAISYIKDELKPGAKLFSIKSWEGQKIIQRNIPLVKLPYEGTKECKLNSHVWLTGWKQVLQKLGIRSLNPDIEYKEKPRG